MTSKVDKDSTCNMQRKKRVEDITNNPGLMQKNKLKDSIWSIEPITLKLKPGDDVILENILLNPEYRVTRSYLAKELQECYTDKYVCIFMLSMSSAHAESTVLDTIMLRDVQHEIESCGGKFKVPISELQQKTVCLLFYEDNLECRKRMEELKQVYKLHKDFEVVVVFPVSFGQHAFIQSAKFNKWRRELEFWKVFGDMPWLAVPFEDPKCRQLWRVFMRTKKCNNSNASKLFIIHSKDKYFEENGFQILKDTGFTNYPFMGEEVVPSAIALRGKKLSSILEPNIELLRARDLDDAQGGLEEFKVSKLFGAPIVFLFVRASGFSEFLSRLQCYHFRELFPSHSWMGYRCRNVSLVSHPTVWLGNMAHHFNASWSINKFEVVYIPMNESAHDIDSHWMLTSVSAEFKEKHLIPLFHHFFKEEIMTQNAAKEFTLALVTFGMFGHYFDRGTICSNSYEAAYELFLKTFPFKFDGEKKNFESVMWCNPS